MLSADATDNHGHVLDQLKASSFQSDDPAPALRRRGEKEGDCRRQHSSEVQWLGLRAVIFPGTFPSCLSRKCNPTAKVIFLLTASIHTATKVSGKEGEAAAAVVERGDLFQQQKTVPLTPTPQRSSLPLHASGMQQVAQTTGSKRR